MKPTAFEYFAPETLEAALELKAQHGDEAKPLAGGQSLIPAMNFRVAQPTILVDLNRVAELSYIHSNGSLTIGAMTRQSQAEKDPQVSERAPLLHQAIPYIAHPQIRNRGTIGGSIAHADPAAELPVVCLALGARMHARSTSNDRWIDSATFFPGLFSTALQSDELLIEIEFPELPANTGFAFLEVARRHGDYAMAGLAAIVTLNDDGSCAQAALVYLNVGDGPVKASQAEASLIGRTLTPQAFKEAGQIASQKDMAPFGNVHASSEYQRHLSATLTERALNTALQRAQDSQKASRL